jgi:hypothetical protein
MSEPAHRLPNDPYELACDQAIEMCGGSVRGAIKALIMANEYLEAELRETQAAMSSGYARGKLPREAEDDAVPPRRADWYD